MMTQLLNPHRPVATIPSKSSAATMTAQRAIGCFWTFTNGTYGHQRPSGAPPS